MLGLIVAWSFAALVPQDDAAAVELLKKVEAKVMQAKTLQVEFDAAPEGRSSPVERTRGVLRIGEGAAFDFTATTSRGSRKEEYRIQSDGRFVRGAAPRGPVDFSKWKPAAFEKVLRRAASQCVYFGAIPAFQGGVNVESLFEELAPQEVKAEGKEKVGDVEATVVTYRLNLKDGPEEGLTVKLWIDPAALAILKRQFTTPRTMNEKTTRFDLDVAFPAEAFEFQTEALFLEGRTIQLARAVSLHARFTGRLPKTLEDLKRRPADLPAAVFWPDQGFWIGGAIPKDIPYAVEADGFTVGSIKEPMPEVSPIGAPTDRLKRFFNYRVTTQLIKGAAQGYAKATSQAPGSLEDLLRKPSAARFWPEGGWVGGGKAPVDPWGDAYTSRSGTDFSVSLSKPKGKTLKPADLTPEERKGLESVALPALGEKEAAEVAALIAKLGSENLGEREGATKSLIDKGGCVLGAVTERLAKEQDPEVASRLGMVVDHFKSMRRMWMSELKGLRFSLSGTGGDPAMIPRNERNGSTSLKTLTTAQADFRSNDRDGNRICDFYARDVAGLYGLEGAMGPATEAKPGTDARRVMRLIESALARADATEDRWEYPVLGAGDPQPYNGYLYAALKSFELEGKTLPYHTGNGRHEDCFGFIAYPAEYGVTGRKTFIVNEDNTIWQKDLAGEEIDTFPGNPVREGWTKLD